MAITKKRKICFVITSPIHYSRNLFVLRELNRIAHVDLHVILGGSAVLPRFTAHDADTETLLRNDDISQIHHVTFSVEGDTPVTKAKSSGLGIIEFSSLFHNLRPDVVVVRGDRFEVLAATIAAVYLNIPVAHIEGGDETGTMDESVRYAITKFAHLHFATNDQAKKRILALGEHPARVYNFGSPDVEAVIRLVKSDVDVNMSGTGSGFSALDVHKPYLLVMYHPVTTELDRLSRDTRELIRAVHDTKVPALWFWPNADAGSEIISHELRRFNDQVTDHHIRFTRYLQPRLFNNLLRKSVCLVGNSSAGIKECAWLGVPVVNIGTRQQNRLRSSNVVDVRCTASLIRTAILRQVKHGPYQVSHLYYRPGTARKIANVLARKNISIQKRFFEPKQHG